MIVIEMLNKNGDLLGSPFKASAVSLGQALEEFGNENGNLQVCKWYSPVLRIKANNQAPEKICNPFFTGIPNLEELKAAESQKRNRTNQSNKWAALRGISTLYENLAWLVGVVSILGAFVGIFILMQEGGFFAGIAILLNSVVGGAIGTISCIFVSQMILLWISIEENTRGTLENLEARRSKAKKPVAS